MPLRSLSEAYSVLEIHATATESEIKSSYKRLALKTHPDKNLNDPHASVKFQQITEAFQMVTSRLSGEREYSRYDGDYDVDSEEFEEDDEDFNLFDDEKFARDLFNFIFSGKDGGKSFFFKFMNKTPCQCASCMDAKREQQDREEYRAFQAAKEKKQAESASKRPENFDPHANWLSDDEGDGAVKRSGMARGTKKQSKKKKGKQKGMQDLIHL